MAIFNVPDYIFIPLAAVAALSSIMLIMFIAVSMKIPFYLRQLKAAFKKKPMYFVHMLNRGMEPFVTARKNGDENTLDLPAYLGAKYVPDSSATESYGLLKAYHAFEKSALAHSPEYSAAITTLMRAMEQHGIAANINVVDALFYAKLEPEEMVCIPSYTVNQDGSITKNYFQVQVTSEEYAKLEILKEDLEQRVVENGLITYDKVQEFLQYSEFQNAQNLDEARSILYRKAVEEATNPNKTKDYIQLAIAFLMVGTIIVVILKAAGML